MSQNLRAGIVRVLNRDGEIVGSGFFASMTLVMTCAHVIRSAGGSPGKPVRLRLSDDREVQARVEAEYWREEEAEDVAVLRLETALEAVTPLELGSSGGGTGHGFSTYGFPTPRDEFSGSGEVIGTARIKEIVFLQLRSAEVTTGFSGAPVFDEVSRRVIGMIAAITRPDPQQRLGETALAVSVETLQGICPELQLSDLCPYRSLDTFAETDAGIFFGRQRMIDLLLESLRREPQFLAVLGPSGSGKSSVVQAGLVPALKNGRLRGSKKWEIVTIRPQNQPFEALAGAGFDDPESGLSASIQQWLGAHPKHTRLVLVIDQFEELLVNVPEEVRQEFIQQLAELLQEASWPVSLVLVMRDDFYSRFIQMAEPLVERLSRSQVIIPPTLSGDELRQMILEPARQMGLSFEEGLVETIVNEASGGKISARSTVLPLLEFTLAQLWNARQEGKLLHSTYRDELGGLTGGLIRWADGAYKKIEAKDQPLAQRLLTTLVHLGSPAESLPDSRQRVAMKDLGRTPDEQVSVRRVINTLTARDSRLLVTWREEGTEYVELIHDALIREWHKLNAWVNDNRPFLTWHQSVKQHALLWLKPDVNDTIPRDEKLLFGSELTEARDWLQKRENDLGQNELNYIQASLLFHERETKRQKEAASRLKKTDLTMKVLIGVLVSAIVVGAFFYSIYARSAKARLINDRANQVYQNDPLLGIRLSLEALAMIPPQDRQNYEGILQSTQDMIKNQLYLGKNVEGIIPNTKNTFLILKRSGLPSELRRMNDGALVSLLSGRVTSATFSPDSAAGYVVLAYADKTPDELRLTSDGSVILKFAAKIANAAFSSDPKAGYLVLNYTGDVPGELRRTGDGSVVAQLSSKAGSYQSVSFSSDPKVSYAFVKPADASPGELRRTSDGSVVPLPDVPTEVQFSPDPDIPYFVVNYKDRAEQRSLADAAVIKPLDSPYRFGVMYSLDSQKSYFVTTNGEGAPARLRRSADDALLAEFPTEAASFSFSQDQKASLFLANYVGMAPVELRRFSDGLALPFTGKIKSILFDDGSVGISSSYYIILYDDQPSEIRRIKDHSVVTTLSGSVQAAFFSAHKRFVLINYAGGPGSELRRVRDGSIVAKLSGEIAKVTFSQDGEDRYAAIDYGGAQPGELRQTGDGSLITKSSGTWGGIIFSTDPKTSYAVANYTTGQPGEWMRLSDGLLLAKLSGKVASFTFSPAPKISYTLVKYADDLPDELRRTGDGSLVTKFSGKVSSTTFSPDPAMSYVVVTYPNDLPSELRRTVDGSLLTKLPGKTVYPGVIFSSDPKAAYFVVSYAGDLPGELRRSGDGSLVTKLSGKAGSFHNVSFSADPKVSYLFVDYDKLPKELRRTEDGAVVPLTDLISNVSFSPDPALSYFVVKYKDTAEQRSISDAAVIKLLDGFYGFTDPPVSNVTYSSDPGQTYFVESDRDGSPLRLRRSKDGSLVSFSGTLSGVFFAPDPGASLFGVAYKDQPGEIRRLEDHALVATLSGIVENVVFQNSASPSEAGAGYAIVHYTYGLPSELRRMEDGSLITRLSGRLTNVISSPDPKVGYSVINYTDEVPSELRRTGDGSLVVRLPGQVGYGGATFSPDPKTSYVMVNYAGDLPDELRRTEDGSLVTQFIAPVMRITFSSDPKASYLMVNYANKLPGELRRTEDGSLVARLSEKVIGIAYSSDPKASYFVETYTDGLPGELRRLEDGSLIARLSGSVTSVSFSSDPKASYIVVNYANNLPGELRRSEDGAVIDLPPNRIDGIYFIPAAEKSYFVVTNSGNPVSQFQTFSDGTISRFGYFEEIERISPLKNAASPCFAVQYKKNKIAQFVQTKDGSPVSLSGSVEEILFRPEPENDAFLVDYKDANGELRRIQDNKVLSRLSGRIYRATFNPMPGSRYFLVDYLDGLTSELRLADDGSLIAPLSGSVNKVVFSPNPESGYALVEYSGAFPNELRRLQDGLLVSRLSGRVSRATFSSDAKASYVLVEYVDKQPDELIRTADGSVVAQLSDKLADYPGVIFSPDPNASYVVLNYAGDLPTEMRRTGDGSLVTQLSSKAAEFQGAAFSLDPGVSYVFVKYIDKLPGELRRTRDGSVVPLPSAIVDVQFSPEPDLPYFVVNYKDRAEQRRLSDASLIKPLDGTSHFNFTYGITYSPDPKKSYFMTNYGKDVPLRLHRMADGAAIPLSGTLSNIFWIKEPDFAYFLVAYNDQPGELRRMDTGEVVAAFSGSISSVKFGPEENSPYFIVLFQYGGEVWTTNQPPHRLLSLDSQVDMSNVYLNKKQLILRYGDSNAYILNMDLLELFSGSRSRITKQEILRQACDSLFAPGSFDVSRLDSYLDGGKPQACP